MRDIIVTGLVFGSLPFILWRPWIGIIVWCWISYMNPHRLTWGFAIDMPFALLVALTTLLGLLLSRETKKFPLTRETVVLLLFICWMVVTTQFAIFPELAWTHQEKVLKIQLMTFVTLILINSRERLHALIWIIALSLGFYGVKGGIFTILHGGTFRVQGPPGTFIGGNNEMALALVMTIPLLRYLQLHATNVWIRFGLSAAMVLSAIAAIGSHSRGALVAIGAMTAFLWIKSRNRFVTAVLVVIAATAIFAIMPATYYDRMSTIQNYEQDASAQGRLNAWAVGWNLAKDRPIVGGGFDAFQPALFAVYAPNPDDYHDVHSIYFEVLGEHGFVGLVLFLLLGLFTWATASKIRRQSKGSPDLKWLGDLTSMVQVSLIGFAVGGVFLGLAYFDFYYHLVAVVIIAKSLLLEQMKGNKPGPAGQGPLVLMDGAAEGALGRALRP